jgi:5,10-methylenetetrahydrofolate reductase
MFDYSYLVEILTPMRSGKQPDKEKRDLFAGKYQKALAAGCGLSVPDNPMGRPRYSLMEMIQQCDLPVDTEKTVMNLNTFHEKKELDDRLNTAAALGIKYVLVIRGDGGPALSKLDPKSIGGLLSVATTMDLLRYINREYVDLFITGAAFNQYNPISFESDRLKQKVDAGAKFVITQPVIGKDPNVDLLEALGIPIVIEAWMSNNVDLLLKSVGRKTGKDHEAYDPIHNLQVLHDAYSGRCVYLSMLSFKEDWTSMLPRM